MEKVRRLCLVGLLASAVWMLLRKKQRGIDLDSIRRAGL